MNHNFVGVDFVKLK